MYTKLEEVTMIIQIADEMNTCDVWSVGLDAQSGQIGFN